MGPLPKLTAAVVAILVIAVVLSPRPAAAQAVSGNITGTVTDPSGAAVPNADVEIADVNRGTQYRTKSNTDGNFTQTHLLPGRYRLRIQAAGFGEFTTEAEVQVDATTRVEAPIQVQQSAVQVSVTAETPLLKTDRTDVSNTITGPELTRLPILDRNVTSLLLALPGAQLGNQVAASENPQSGLQVNVNGQLGYSNGFQLDGTENHSNILGITVVNPNPDALEEMKVTSSNYDAEFGNASGALIQATTKSGTNELHGSLFEYLRNDKLNAADPFTNLKPPLRWNQFGGTVGGPLIKNRLFGFFAYQGTRRRTGAALITTVPTEAERSGDLSALLGDYICADGSTSPSECAAPLTVPTTEGTNVAARAGMIFDPRTGNADGSGRQAISAGGRVNVLTPAGPMRKLLDFIPLSNSGVPGQTFNNYIGSFSQQFDTDQYDGRSDYNVTDNIHIFGRYSIANFNLHSPGAYGEIAGGPTGFGFAGQSLARNQSGSLGFTYALSPTLITDSRFGAYRYRVRVFPNGTGTPALDAGIPGLNTGSEDTTSMPAFNINGDAGFQFGYSLGVNGCNCPLRETENHFQWVNNWTKQSGNHSIKWGADIRRASQTRISSELHRSGELTFAPTITGSADVDNLAAGRAATGSGLASYLLGLPSYFARESNGPGYYPSLRQNRLYFFGQDTWRVTPKLTLNYGLRYENYLPQTALQPGGGGSFDPVTGEALVAGVGDVPNTFGIKAYNLGFAPRVGFAYQLRSTTVIRAGYGRSFNAAGVGAVFGQNPELDAPTVVLQNVNQPNQYTSAIPNLLTNGPPTPVLPPVGPNGRFKLPDQVQVYFYFYPLDSYRIPLADLWNFSIQQQIQPNLTAEVAYVGNVGRHLFINPNTNQAIPGPGDYDPRRPFYKFGLTQAIYSVCNCDNSSYNSLQAKLQKRASNGLDLLITYTFSKAMTNSEGGYGYTDSYNIRNDHGPATWDRRHALTILHTWELPFGKGKKWGASSGKVANAVAGGWRFSGVSTLLSGVAFSPGVSSAPLLNADFGARPDVVGDPSVSNPNRDLWFNPAAYTPPQQPFRNGTASKGSLRGPAQYLFNLSLSKSFMFGETKSLEFRWENFNAFNHTNLGLPESTVDVSGAGQITSAATDMRQMQLGLHFRF
jgi:hypothetical protein